ncbi:MAG: hypothetical protein C0481_02855 [Phenylobacterium sp.]|nr:hypothetical protein [Phenylobacterium sp.]
MLDDLHVQIGRLAARIGASIDLLPSHDRLPGGTWIGLAWHEGDDGDDPDGWYLSLMREEDGVDWELAEVLASDPDHLLYVLFDEVTAKLARAAVENSNHTDQRRRWFAAQEDLLGRLNDEWRARTVRRHVEMLSS